MIGTRKTAGLVLSGCALLLWTAAGCSDGDDDPTAPSTESGRIQIEMTDAPFPYSMVESADVTIDAVEVHHSEELEGSAWITVDESLRALNLLDLQNGTTVLLADVPLPVGAINQIRLHVVDSSITLTDGRTFDLEIPSGDQSGIKIFPDRDIEISSDFTTRVLLDFDVSQSFLPIPASPRQVENIQSFHFRPTIHVATLGETGSLSGRVYSTLGTMIESDDLPLPGATVLVYSDSQLVASTASDDDGTFLVMGLAPGTYRVEITVLDFFGMKGDVTVESDANTEIGEVRLDPILP